MTFGKKYSEALVEKMCKLIRENDITLRDVLLRCGISNETYYTWREKHPGFTEKIEQAHEERLEKFVTVARSGLITLLTGRTYVEVTKVYSIKGKGKNAKKVLVGEKHITKFVLPNVTAVLATLKSLDPKNFSEILRATQPGQGALNGPVPLSIQVLNTSGIEILEEETDTE